ncbi:hypothetical protein GQ42DRAFT_181942 [Ramicandelaber brevisporus]|nr:hypothetical protein GQ42DRAFT_181942 [Ramicandelaber brevisporus]
MPPKRRRTIIKPSTALDSLRAKIRSFADTADEEQLREVARLVDRLSISNSEPFRLFDLPYELLEYTAERYFTLEEAASFLSVNRVFSELFGNSTWKRLDFDDTMVDECEGSLDVLKKNLRRVRVLDLWSVKPGFSVSNYFPFATEIAFEVEDGREIMFTLHLEKMKCLRRVTLTITKMSHRVMDAAAKWVDDSHRSGHVQQIVIRVENSVIYRKAIHSMALLMDKIKSKRRIRLDCGSPELFPTSVIQFMPVTLTKLIIPQIIPRGCCGKVNKQVFGAGLESVFVHLHTLRIQVCCNKSSLYDFQSFVPERFPVLSYLAMYVPKQSCHGDAEIPLETIFYNKQWPSVTDLELVGNETKMPEALTLS